jgi:hypothetical protein
MQHHEKVCNECGVTLEVGLAKCSVCGARAGTVFSEGAPPPLTPKTAARKIVDERLSMHSQIEQAHERANHSVILSLIGLCPIIGFVLAPFSIFLAVRASRVLKENHIEEGRGIAAAGIVIGALGVLAQFSYFLLMISSKGSPTSMFGL